MNPAEVTDSLMVGMAPRDRSYKLRIISRIRRIPAVQRPEDWHA